MSGFSVMSRYAYKKRSNPFLFSGLLRSVRNDGIMELLQCNFILHCLSGFL